jgi:uracil-DNA glycosylase family 4
MPASSPNPDAPASAPIDAPPPERIDASPPAPLDAPPPERIPAEWAEEWAELEAEWAEISADITACRACPELATRTNAVVGDLPASWTPATWTPQTAVRLVFVGEAPGAQEDAAGRPFVGKAGQLLDRLLADAGMARAEVGVLNVAKCRPPGNRTPQVDEIARCRPYLTRQLNLLQPKLIVALGLTAVTWFLGRRVSLSAARGVVHTVGDLRVIATYHPSAAIRFGPQGAPMTALREDLAFAARTLAEAPA